MQKKKCKVQFLISAAHEQDGLGRCAEYGISENSVHLIGNEKIAWAVHFLLDHYFCAIDNFMSNRSNIIIGLVYAKEKTFLFYSKIAHISKLQYKYDIL